MVETGFTPFNTMVDKANRLLKEIEEAFGWPKERRNQSYAALRAVLHALRDRLPVDEAVQFGAQLPTLVRGVYYDGWKPSKTPMKLGTEEFLERVQGDFPYAIDGGTGRLVHTVLDTLKNHISPGEWEDIKSSLPGSLAGVLP